MRPSELPGRDRREIREGASSAQRIRTWLILVPTHLVVFALLYGGALLLLERSFLGASSQAARQVLAEVVRGLEMVMPSGEGGPSVHRLRRLEEIHQAVDLRLYDRQGLSIAGRDDSLVEIPTATSGEPEFRLERSEDRYMLRAVAPVVAVDACAPCHSPGSTLAVATVALDMTEVREALYGNVLGGLVVLLLLWGGGAAVSTHVVKRSAERSARQLKASLDGEPGEAVDAATGVVLDPVSAELHGSLRDLLVSQREREAQFASRLAHTDQLATLGKLAAGLAHEIKNPLAGIQGALEILNEDAEEGSEAAGLYDQMLAELKRVDRTLRLLLASARPSPPQRVPTDPRELLESVVALTEPGLRRRNVRLELDLAADLPVMPLDPDKIRQVVLNLVGNASEAIEGGGRVRIRAAPYLEASGLLLAVEDDGPGIPEEHRQKVFEPFFTTKFTGTGLGLAIVRTLVEQHGGDVRFECGEDGGTTVYVVLPALEVEDSPAQRQNG